MDLDEEEAKALQRDVQRLLGRCILRLQQYEKLLKAFLVGVEISGEPQDLASIGRERERPMGRKTLGTLVGELLGSYLIAEPPQAASEPSADGAEGPATFSFHMKKQLSPEDHAQTASDMRELVDLRNMLVHHFAAEHDLWTAKGCRKAQAALISAYEQIDQSHGRLVDLARDMQRMKELVTDDIQSETFRNLVVHGIAPDGTVDWLFRSLVSGFREAARALAQTEGEWIPVAKASEWIVGKYPDQTPSRFGCKTWQQALQESRLFDLRRQVKGGSRVICFKEKATPKLADAPERTWEFNGSGAMKQP